MAAAYQTAFGLVSIGSRLQTKNIANWKYADVEVEVVYIATESGLFYVRTPDGGSYQWRSNNFTRINLPKRGSNMLQDIRAYIKDNRQVLYTVAFIVALDHFVFNGAFRERLKGLVDGMLKRVEEKTK